MKKHIFTIDEDDADEKFTHIEFITSLDENGHYWEQWAVFYSEAHTVKIDLNSCPLTPEVLRRFADSLEKEIKKLSSP